MKLIKRLKRGRTQVSRFEMDDVVEISNDLPPHHTCATFIDRGHIYSYCSCGFWCSSDGTSSTRREESDNKVSAC